ncbi:PREDICTED: cornulin-like [Buceros rhinoceros silvestris]|uniref:cornulin-like n=1 Tax=Buceros rhinoceros silvestris TaxID=175836 RepID=UPI000528A3D7|nr:PREDICTED: cornulin-like [Buceros rhinoceros silvestris]
MAQPPENIDGIIAAFCMCTRSDGNCSPLSRAELRQLIEQEFTDTIENPQDPKTIKKVLCFLDDNSNCRVDFSEVLSLVFHVAKACYKPPQQHQPLEEEQTAPEKAGGEHPLGPRTAGRVFCNQQKVPEQGVNNQVQNTESQDPDNHQNQEDEAQEQDQDTPQTQEGETPEQDQDTTQDDGTEAPEGDPERGEILDSAAHKTGETEILKEDPKTHETQEPEAPGQGSNLPQNPEMESAEQDLNSPSETQGRDPNTTQVCEAPWQDPNPDKPQNLLPPQRATSPCRDPEPQRTHHNLALHQPSESEVLNQEHGGAEAPPCPAQDDTHQPTTEQQLLQSLYHWPPQQ